MNNKNINHLSSRRQFLKISGIGTVAAGLYQFGCSDNKRTKEADSETSAYPTAPSLRDPYEGYVPFSDRKLRVGLVGYGACEFSAQFGFQNHPNVEVVAVSDLFPDRCKELARVTNCKKTYPSLEEMVKDDKIEAIYCATDAPSHARHAILCLKHGKHVASAVPAVYGSLEDAEMLFEEVKRSGLKYMMFETSCFRADLYAMRQIYKAGGFGRLIYTEGEYYHGPSIPIVPGVSIGSYKNWRRHGAAQWYGTHGNAYYIGVTDGTFTEVSCLGIWRDPDDPLKGKYNRPSPDELSTYKNPIGSEIALFRTGEGGIARMARTSTPGMESEVGRVQGEKGFYNEKYVGTETNLPDLNRPPLPPGLPLGDHGGSHGYLTHEFVSAIIQDRKPLVDIEMALNMTVPGIFAHESALKDGEVIKIPQFRL